VGLLTVQIDVYSVTVIEVAIGVEEFWQNFRILVHHVS
jgi:hypothetical protein